MSDEQSFALEDAVAEIAKSECPSDWARYCQLAHVPGSDQDPEGEARKLLKKRALSRYDTTYEWVAGAPHLEEAINLEHKFREKLLSKVWDGRCVVRAVAGDLREVVAPSQLLTHQSLKLDHNGIMHLGESKLFGVRVVFTAPQEAPDASQEAPGPKPGRKTVKQPFCRVVLKILNDEAARPAKRKGRRTILAQMVQKEVGASYKLNSIEKMIRETITDWETDNPDK